jgi:Transposase DDE domain
LPFARVLTLILRGHKLPIQISLNKVFGALDAVDHVPTASAYSQARRKLKPEVFLYLNTIVSDHLYQQSQASRRITTWHGRRVLAADGTYLNVPDTPETRVRYSLQENQWDGGACVQALASVLYDLRSDIGLNAVLDTKRAEKDFLFDQHLGHTSEGDVIVLDRLYADSAVLAFWLGHRRDFVIRFPRGSFKQVQRFWESDDTDTSVEIAVTGKQRHFVRERGLPEVVRIRLVKVVLASGEIEVLGTSLLNPERYPGAELKQVYGWRWGVET